MPENRAATVLYGRSYFTDVEGKVIGKYPTEPFDVRRLAQFNFICQPSTFFSKHALDAVGGLDRGLHYVMDYDLWIRLAGHFEFTYLLQSFRIQASRRVENDFPKSVPCHFKEALDMVRKYYGWSPLNRVYLYCYHVLKSKLPSVLTTFKLPLLPGPLPFALVKYVSMNKGIRLEDLKMITPSNIRKLFMGWIDIYKQY